MSSAIPSLPPLTGVSDEQTRLALKAIYDQLNVRNGYVGDGSDKFLTVADLESVLSGKAITVGGGKKLVVSGATSGSSGPVASLVNAAVNSVTSSYIWRKLEERLTWIEMPTWFANKFGAAIQVEQTVRQQADAALAAQVTTAVANINNNIALAQESISAAADLAGASASAVTQLQTKMGGTYTSPGYLDPVTGDYVPGAAVSYPQGVEFIAQQAFSTSQNLSSEINGSYSVKFQIGANGQPLYATGFGLGVTHDGGAPTSAFVVKADSFAVGGPGIYVDGQLTPSLVPFVVKTTPWTESVGGTVVTHDPGVYMTDVKIANATIDNLVVTTSLIAPGAVSGVGSGSGSSGVFTLNGTVEAASVSDTLSGLGSGQTASGVIMGTVALYENGGGDYPVDVYVLVDGVLVGKSACTLGESKSVTAVGKFEVGNGDHTYALRIQAGGKSLAYEADVVFWYGKR